MQRSRTPRAHLVLQCRRIIRELSGLTFFGGQMSEYKSNHRSAGVFGRCALGRVKLSAIAPRHFIKPAVQPPSHPRRR